MDNKWTGGMGGTDLGEGKGVVVVEEGDAGLPW